MIEYLVDNMDDLVKEVVPIVDVHMVVEEEVDLALNHQHHHLVLLMANAVVDDEEDVDESYDDDDDVLSFYNQLYKHEFHMDEI